MSGAMRFTICAMFVAILSTGLVFGQLSQNSGINSNDTWAAFDLSLQTQAAISSSSPLYDPATQTTSNTLNTPATSLTYHVEVGYDSSGGLVMNLWPGGTFSFPISDEATVSVIRYAAGKLTVFDQDGAPVTWVPPANNVPAFNPFNLLGSNPGSSILSELVVSNIQQQAQTTNSQLTYNGPQAMLAGSFQNGESNGNSTWSYVQSGSMWVAQQATFAVSKPNYKATRVLQFSGVSWHDNASSDSARTSRGYTAVMPPTPTTSTPPAATPASSSNCPPYSSNFGAAQNVVFQHGFFSDGCTWKRMIPWLNHDFRWGIELDPTLNSLDNLSNQGNVLISDINSAGGTGYLLLGHSQGGLISRYAAQQYWNTNQIPGKVNGVLTLDTPHQGAPLASFAANEIYAVLGGDSVNLYGAVGCYTPNDNFLCYLSYLMYGTAGQIVNLGAISDLVPRSQFLQNLNSQPEGFTRAAVVSSTHRRWIESRVAQEIFLGRICNPEDWCGERNFALATEVTYDVVQGAFFFALFDCIWTQNPIACTIAWNYLLPIIIYMDIADIDYNLLAAGGAKEDGFVPLSSQNYPSSTAVQYPISDADSHMGATRSNRARNALTQALLQTFHVQTQSTCTFSVTPTSFSTSSSATTSSFNVTAGAGCQWSAVSNSPWIGITSGASGTSSAAVVISVAANSASVPRTGSITIGNGTSKALFTVQQSAYCGYTLSTYTIALPPAGGNGTINVSAPAGCPWTAVPNAAWLSIAAGSSGTGSGTFTVTASPNSNNFDLLGTVTLMNQILTVIVGDPTGTPGTGSVTISGSPQSKSANGCPNSYPYNCWYTIYEGGSVSVTVRGQIFTTSYGGPSFTSAQLASALASQMNYQNSPISATVSGSKITISSSVNGAATNYSLSTSYMFDTTNFSSPAFAASASGATLTGGTN
jgi:pimeloyl-ACP methyl ester carboxylesterase